MAARATADCHPPSTSRVFTRKFLRTIRTRRLVFRVACPFTYFAIFAAMRLIGRYRIRNLREIRRSFREIAERPFPLLICANHMTFVDSALIIWALGSLNLYTRKPSLFSWNIPAADVFQGRLRFRLLALLGKCIFIDREGSPRHKAEIVDLCCYLLRDGNVVTIFPEGRRSRTGRFESDTLAAGVGRIVARLGECDVLCIYLRGDRQDNFSDYPPRGSAFVLTTELLAFRESDRSREAARKILRRIGESISALEQQHFGHTGIDGAT